MQHNVFANALIKHKVTAITVVYKRKFFELIDTLNNLKNT